MTEKRKPGRPSLGPHKGKRHAMGVRTTAQLKAAIEGAAARSGRSVAQEIEMRLEYSFRDDDVMDMLAAMAERMERIERVLWDRVPHVLDSTAALEGGPVTPKEACELGYTANELREFARR